MKKKILDITIYSAMGITIMLACAFAYNSVVPAYQ